MREGSSLLNSLMSTITYNITVHDTSQGTLGRNSLELSMIVMTKPPIPALSQEIMEYKNFENGA